jgi:hypothetical protein
MENGVQEVRSTLGELRNSAKKLIGKRGLDKDISMLEAKVN